MANVALSKPSENAESENLVDCEHCGRHFKADRIETHECICKNQKQRKPFDVSQQRIRGTEVEKYLKKIKGRPQTEKKPAPQKNWRKEHEEFINSMRAARQATAMLKRGENLKNLPPPPPSVNPDYVQCPGCSRKFNPDSAERHIPKCLEIQRRKPNPKSTKAHGKADVAVKSIISTKAHS